MRNVPYRCRLLVAQPVLIHKHSLGGGAHAEREAHTPRTAGYSIKRVPGVGLGAQSAAPLLDSQPSAPSVYKQAQSEQQ